MKKIRYSLILIFTVVLYSCHKIETLPDVPHIEYTNFSIFDTTDILGNISKGGRLRFYFEDGDGDLGLTAPNTINADSTNLFMTIYRKINGEMIPVVADNDPLKPSEYRIPYMTRLGRNQILKGTISVTFLYPFYTRIDTVMYDFYIKDRALNESNVASTNEIVLSENGIY
jgi:hypothetical protein